jgi:hypothetical protein
MLDGPTSYEGLSAEPPELEPEQTRFAEANCASCEL